MPGRIKIIESALKKCEREVKRRINQIFQSKSFQWGHLVVGHCCNSPKKLVKPSQFVVVLLNLRVIVPIKQCQNHLDLKILLNIEIKMLSSLGGLVG